MDEIKRTRYFQHEILDSDDFIDEQEYHRNMRYLHNSRFHTWGILEGLEVAGQETKVTISMGTAVDGKGREIVLPASKTIDFNDYQAGMAYYITIRWNQQEGLPRQEDEFKRWEEIPGIDVSEEEPLDKDMNLVLAYVKLKSENNIIESIDNSMCKYATLAIGDKSVTSVKLSEADGTTSQDTNVGSGVKTAHLQDGAVTEAKLDAAAKGKLVTGGDNHTHGMSQLSDYNSNDNKIKNLQNPTDDKDAANKIYVDEKTGGTVSSNTNIENVATSHTRQVNVSWNSSARGDRTQLNASTGSTADGAWSQVNASDASTATNECAQVNACGGSNASGKFSQVNACEDCTASGHMSQVNAGKYSTASGMRSQVNASYKSTAIGEQSQVNASYLSIQNGRYSQITGSMRVTNNDNFALSGGYSTTGEASAANMRWTIWSTTGNVYISGTVHSGTPFGDYGEYFENLKNGKIDVGLLIALEGAKVRPAKKDEDFIGVVSGTAGIRLGDTPFCWQGRYLVDEWGRTVYEEIKDPDWKPKTVPDEKWKPKEGQTEADRPMTAVETEKDRPLIRVQKENPDYDPQKKQEPRSERPEEWTLVGLVGQVYVRCDGTVKPGDFVKSKGRGMGTKSEEKTRLRAMKVTREYDGSYSIVYCLLL